MSKTLQQLKVDPGTKLVVEAPTIGRLELGLIERAVERATATSIDSTTGQRIALGFDDSRYVFTCRGVRYDDLMKRSGGAHLEGSVEWGARTIRGIVDISNGGNSVIVVVRRQHEAAHA